MIWQVWHQSTGRVITGKQRRGECLIRANLESLDTSETAGILLLYFFLFRNSYIDICTKGSMIVKDP